MRRLALAAILATAVLTADGACFGAGLDSGGNTDGVLTWQLGTVEAGRSVREVILFAFDSSHEKVAKRVQQARREFANLPDPPPVPAGAKPQPTAWIKNDSTDFALEGPGHFFWEGKRQSLTSKRGGQCSRFGWYVHYTAGGDCIDPKTDPDPAENEGDEHLYYCQDANFNTTALVDGYDGAVVERYRYDPYGKVSVRHGVRPRLWRVPS